MRTSYKPVSSARRFSSWLIATLGLAAYVGLIYGLTLLPLQVEVPLPHWGWAVVPPVVYGLLVLLFVRRPSIVRWLVGTAVLSGLHVLLGLARRPITALVDPALAGHPLTWMLPPPLPELVGVMLLLVPLRDALRARPRVARERVAPSARTAMSGRGRAVAVPRPQPMGLAESVSPPATRRAELATEPALPEAPTVAATARPAIAEPVEESFPRKAAPRVERQRATVAVSPPRRSSVVLRIALDRVMPQLPPGTFLAPEDEVAASLADPGYLRIPGQLVVTQLGEGVARVAWSDIVDQFPPHLVGLGSEEIGEHLGDGLRLPLDEVVGQLGHELFVSEVPEIEVPGLDRIPIPFHPSGEAESAPGSYSGRALETTPPAGSPRVAAPPTPTPGEMVVSRPEPTREVSSSPVAGSPPPLPAEPVRGPQAEPAPSPVPKMDGPTVRISFDRVASEIPAELFRAPLEQVAREMWEPGSLVVPLSAVLPQLAEGLIQVGWGVVGPQFPRNQLAVSEAEVLERLPSGIRLPLDEVIRQVPPDLFMAAGPAADVRGLESFPAPFQPLVSDPSPAPPPPVAVAEPEPVRMAGLEPPTSVPSDTVADTAPERVPGLADPAEPAPSIAAEMSSIVEPDLDVAVGAVSELEPAAPSPLAVQAPVAAAEPIAPEPLAESPATFAATEADGPDPARVISEWTPEPVTLEPEPATERESARLESLAAAPPPMAEPVPESVPAAPVAPATDRVWPDNDRGPSPTMPPGIGGSTEAAEARRIVAQLAPIAAFDASVQAMDGVTVFALTAPTVAQEMALAAAGLALPLLTERRAPWPVDQITLRTPDTALVLTPLGGPRAAVLAAAAPRGGALALLEILSRRAAGQLESRGGRRAAHVLPDEARSLVQVAVPAPSARLASFLTAFGPVTASVLRDTEGEEVFHFFLPAGEDLLAVGAFAQDLQAVMRKAAGSGAVFRTAVLRSGNTLLVIQPEDVGHDRSIVVVAGGAVTRPGLAYRQVERVTAILTKA